MKKTRLVIVLLALLLLLCGCTESEIACGVTADNQAYLCFDLALDMKGLEISEQLELTEWIRGLASSLEKEHGFTVEHNALAALSQVVHLRCVQAESRAAAVAALRELLTDESISPFSAVEAEILDQPLQQSCRLTLRLEPDRLVQTAGIEDFPKRTRERVEQWVAAATIRLRVSLPATELPEGEDAALSDGLAEKELRLGLNEAGELSLSTLIYTGAGDTHELWWRGKSREARSADAMAAQIEADAEKLHGLQNTLTIAAAALGAAGLVFLLWGCLRAHRRRRAAKSTDAPQEPIYETQAETEK